MDVECACENVYLNAFGWRYVLLLGVNMVPLFNVSYRYVYCLFIWMIVNRSGSGWHVLQCGCGLPWSLPVECLLQGQRQRQTQRLAWSLSVERLLQGCQVDNPGEELNCRCWCRAIPGKCIQDMRHLFTQGNAPANIFTPVDKSAMFQVAGGKGPLSQISARCWSVCRCDPRLRLVGIYSIVLC